MLLQLDAQKIGEALEAEASVEENGTIRLDWPEGDFARFHVNGTWLHFDYVFSPDQNGRMTQLATKMPQIAREAGITHFVTALAGDNTAPIHLGFEQDRDAQLYKVEISEGGRLDQYAEFKAGGSEPQWHQELESYIESLESL